MLSTVFNTSLFMEAFVQPLMGKNILGWVTCFYIFSNLFFFQQISISIAPFSSTN